MNDNTVILTYVGRGNFMFNVPARDLTQADVSASGYSLGQVLESHLYQPTFPNPPQFSRSSRPHP